MGIRDILAREQHKNRGCCLSYLFWKKNLNSDIIVFYDEKAQMLTIKLKCLITVMQSNYGLCRRQRKIWKNLKSHINISDRKNV